MSIDDYTRHEPNAARDTDEPTDELTWLYIELPNGGVIHAPGHEVAHQCLAEIGLTLADVEFCEVNEVPEREPMYDGPDAKILYQDGEKLQFPDVSMLQAYIRGLAEGYEDHGWPMEGLIESLESPDFDVNRYLA